MARYAAVLLGLSVPLALSACLDMREGRHHWHHSDYDSGCFSDYDCPLHSYCTFNGDCVPENGYAHAGASNSSHGSAGRPSSSQDEQGGAWSEVEEESAGATGEAEGGRPHGSSGGAAGSSPGAAGRSSGGAGGTPSGTAGSSASSGSTGHPSGGSVAVSCASNTDCSANTCCVCGTGDQCSGGFCQPKPGSGGQCIYNSDCPVSGSVCLNGTCLRGCSSTSQCAEADVCLNGMCQADHGPKPGCSANAECSGGRVCVNAVCRSACQTSADCCSCTAATVCDQGFCVTPGEAAPQCQLASSCGLAAHCVDALCSAP